MTGAGLHLLVPVVGQGRPGRILMRLITVAGPPSSGKTAVICKAAEALQAAGVTVGVVKFDCLSSGDQALFERRGIPARTGLSGNLCPDHFFVSNIEGCLAWGEQRGLIC